MRLEHRSDASDGRALHLELAGELRVGALRVGTQRRLDPEPDFPTRRVQGERGRGIDLLEWIGAHESNANRSSWYREASLLGNGPRELEDEPGSPRSPFVIMTDSVPMGAGMSQCSSAATVSL